MPADETPAYQQIAEHLRQRITAGEFRAGQVLPSIRRLAKACRVGRKVIVQALGLLREQGILGLNRSRRLIIKTAGHMKTVFSVLDRENSGRQGVLLQVLATNLKSFQRGGMFELLQSGVYLGCSDLSLPLLLLHDREWRESVPQNLELLPVRGIILSGGFRESVLRQYERLPLSVVMVDSPAGNHLQLHSVCVDNEAAAAEAAQRLLALGHQRFAFLQRVHLKISDVDPDSKERRAGFIRALKSAGVPQQRWSVFSVMGKQGSTAQCFQTLFKERRTAVLAADAGVAQMLVDAARQAGRKVPEDISVACFRARQSRTRFSGPATDFEALGHQGVLLASAPKLPIQRRRMPFTWVDGDSVAPLK